MFWDTTTLVLLRFILISGSFNPHLKVIEDFEWEAYSNGI
jgi:hypothetical protein